ncbi:MAG: hypothetical protein GC160_02800 [Acidobacteria bacterium]|nr:hypothetical protein [Acidobacteriota bacterium]
MRTNWGYHQKSCLSCGKLFRFLLIARHGREGVSHTGPGGCHRLGVLAGAVQTLMAEFEAGLQEGQPQDGREPFDGRFWEGEAAPVPPVAEQHQEEVAGDA